MSTMCLLSELKFIIFNERYQATVFVFNLSIFFCSNFFVQYLDVLLNMPN